MPFTSPAWSALSSPSSPSDTNTLSRSRSAGHVVVLDYDMPLLDGLETLSYLRAMPGGYGPQVMLVSSNMRHLPKWRFAAMGVTDFLEKPVELGEFAEVLSDVAGRAFAHRNRFGGARHP